MPEGTILAHVGRTLSVARELDAARFELLFAASGEYADRIDRAGLPRRDVYTQPRERLLARLHKNESAFEEAELRRYVEDERRLLGAVRPTVVVGDFRASLGISARLAGVPYVCVTNAVWSPYCAMRLDPPENWLATRLVGKPLLRRLAPFLEPAVFRHYARPFNRVRAEHGLPPVEDVREAMCSDDLTLLADVPEFFPSRDLPEHFRYVGPILWEPEGDRADEQPLKGDGRPTAYLTMGSTGGLARLAELAAALAAAGLRVLCTTGGRDRDALPEGCVAIGFGAGSRLCRAADVVVCHAGNGTVYQALSQGRPVVGVPEFFDQEFNAQRLEALGLGRSVRFGPDLARRVAETAAEVARDAGSRERAATFQTEMKRWNGAKEAAREIAALCERAAAPARTA
jgi:UDP:flavonoid glycosyltransferase YjiC (YdhE family)